MAESPKISEKRGFQDDPESSVDRESAIASTLQNDGAIDSWSAKEEATIVWKLDLSLLPLLVLGFFILQLDRSNISNALTDTLTEDLGITSDQVSTGNQLMLVGIVISEIPANLILQKLGAPVWLTAQMAIWGTIALTQAWCTGLSSFYATRFLLGIFEGGYVPGAQYLLALFYTENELARRTAIFYFGNYFATAVGSLIAAAILKLGGAYGISGWQWLFIIEGSITLLLPFAFILLLPRSPSQTTALIGHFDIFDEKERTILRARITRSDPSRSEAKAVVTLASILESLADPFLWLHCALNVLALAPKGGLQLYGPSIIKSLGFTTTKANLLNSVSSFGVVILSFIISLASDKTRLRGPWCIVSFVYAIAFAGALYSIDNGTATKWTMYAIFTLLSAGNALSQGLNDAWLNINATTAAKRSIGLAMVVIGSNLGGIAGQHLFSSKDRPRYTQSFLAILLMYVACIPVTLLIMWMYWRKNRAGALVDGMGQPRKFQL